jgi:hypothetical protein
LLDLIDQQADIEANCPLEVDSQLLTMHPKTFQGPEVVQPNVCVDDFLSTALVILLSAKKLQLFMRPPPLYPRECLPGRNSLNSRQRVAEAANLATQNCFYPAELNNATGHREAAI